MKFGVLCLPAAVGAAVSVVGTGVWAQEAVGQAVVVSATRIDMRDQDAPYASEVHSREDIERSGVSSLYEYLARQTSLQVTPNYGNRYTPQISMRGYGNENGYQNVVISVDGRRLNNIDMSPQLIGSISLANIERIEITKGSGSVLYGDGATAGTIQIYTKASDGVSLDAHAGNYGARGTVVSAGVVRSRFDLSATLDHSQFGGFSDRDPSGHRDQSEANTWRVAVGGKPVDTLRLDFEAGTSRIDTRYPSSLSLAQFRLDPGMNNGANYTRQEIDTDHWSLGFDYAINQEWRLTARHHDEEKTSAYPAWASEYRYNYTADEVALRFQRDGFALNTGIQRFDGERAQTASSTTKDNLGWFLHGQYTFDALTVSGGLRRERVEYAYKPDAGTTLEADQRMTSWELGASYRLDSALSMFVNYSDAFQSPDIDRFFSTDWFSGVTSFNGFIEPAEAQTITIGANHVVERNRLKASIFYSRLKNEIYFGEVEPFVRENTNIDKSHKYGLELQNTLEITPDVTGVVNYAWTRAIIDREADVGGAYDGKELPGVSRHSLVAGLNIRVTERGNLNLSHTWRSKTWAADDFDNNNTQKQRAYHSTDVAYRYRLTKDSELYAAVSNLFDREHGLWVRDDAIYPIDFERTWKIGARVKF